MEELARRAASGDMVAFEELVRRTQPAVRATVAARVRNPHDVADLVQEVYLRALRGIDRIDDPARVEGWLATIARNATIDHHRRRGRRPTVALDDREPADADIAVDDLVELRELASSVTIAVGRLTPLDASLIAMVSMLGFTPTEIAGALGMTPTAAKVAVHRARNRLRQAMLLQDDVGADPPSCPTFLTLTSRAEVVGAAIHARSCSECSPRRSRR